MEKDGPTARPFWFVDLLRKRTGEKFDKIAKSTEITVL